jgi:hypothetical protein
MPAKSPRSETSPTALSEPAAPALEAPGTPPSADPGPADSDSTLSPADSDSTLSPADRVIAERTERRRQRTAVRGQSGRAREPDPAGPRSGQRESAAHGPQSRMPLRDTVSVRLIAVLAAGAALGAILGALGAPGVVIGLLVAGLTVVLSAKLPRSL